MTHASDRLPLISVIIPTHNYASFLPKAIDSVIRQDYPCFEIIIIDDGSTDNTRLVIPPHRAISYFYQKNRGLAVARNTGIEKAKGEYLVFLDADDWLEKNALAQNYSMIHDKPHIAFVSGNYTKGCCAAIILVCTLPLCSGGRCLIISGTMKHCALVKTMICTCVLCGTILLFIISHSLPLIIFIRWACRTTIP